MPLMVLRRGAMQAAFINQLCHFGKDFTLARDVGGLAQRPGEHEFPMQRDAFAFQRVGVKHLGVVNQRDAALRREQFRQLRQVVCAVVGGKRHEGASMPSATDLFGQAVAVVDDVIRAELAQPCFALWAGGGGDDADVGERFQQLHG